MATPTVRALVNLDISQRHLDQTIRNLQRSLGRVNFKINTRNAVRSLNTVNRTTTTLNKNLADSSKFADQFGLSIGNSARKFAAYAAGTAIVIKLSGALQSAVREAITFDKEIVRIGQVVGKTKNELVQFKKEILEMSVTFGISATKLGEMSVTLAQAGLRGNDLSAAMNAVAKADLAPTFSNMTSTADGLVAVFRQFKIAGAGFEKSLAAINAVSKEFAVESDDIIEAVKRAGGVFAASGGELNEFIALFTSVRATSRESADTIATGLRTILTRIKRPATIKFLKEMGVEIADIDGKIKSPLKAIQLIAEQIKVLGIESSNVKFSELVEELGGLRQVSKLIPLINEATLAQKALKVANEGGESLNKDYALSVQSISKQFEILRSEFNKVIVEIGDTTAFKNITFGIIETTRSIIRMVDALKEVIPFLGLIGGFGLARTVLKGVGGAQPTFKALGGAPAGSILGFAGGTKNVPSGPDLATRQIQGLGFKLPPGDSMIAGLAKGEIVVPKKESDEIRKGRPGLKSFVGGGLVGGAGAIGIAALAGGALFASRKQDGAAPAVSAVAAEVAKLAVVVAGINALAKPIGEVRDAFKIKEVDRFRRALNNSGVDFEHSNKAVRTFNELLRKGAGITEARNRAEKSLTTSIKRNRSGAPLQDRASQLLRSEQGVSRLQGARGRFNRLATGAVDLRQKAVGFGDSTVGKGLTAGLAIGLVALNSFAQQQIDDLQKTINEAEKAGDAMGAYNAALEKNRQELAKQSGTVGGVLGGGVGFAVGGQLGAVIGGAIGTALGTAIPQIGETFTFLKESTVGGDSAADSARANKELFERTKAIGVSKTFNKSLDDITGRRSIFRDLVGDDKKEKTAELNTETNTAIAALIARVTNTDAKQKVRSGNEGIQGDLEKALGEIEKQLNELFVPIGKSGDGFERLESENKELVATWRQLNVLTKRSTEQEEAFIQVKDSIAKATLGEIEIRRKLVESLKEGQRIQDAFNASIALISNQTSSRKGQSAGIGVLQQAAGGKVGSGFQGFGVNVSNLKTDSPDFKSTLDAVSKINEPLNLQVKTLRTNIAALDQFEQAVIGITGKFDNALNIEAINKAVDAFRETTGVKVKDEDISGIKSVQALEDFIKGIAKSALGPTAEKIEEGRKAFADQLVSLASVLDARNELELSRIKIEQGFNAEINKIRDSFGGDVTVEEARGRNRTKARGFASTVGIDIGTNDIDSAKRLGAAREAAIISLAKLEKITTKAGIKTEEQVRAASELKKTVNNTDLAMRALVNSTGTLSAIQDKNARFEQRRTSVLSKISSLSFGGKEERGSFQKNLQLSKFAVGGGNIQSLPEDMRASLFDFLKEFENSAVFGGLTGRQVIDRENAKVLSRQGFNPSQINDILSKTKPIEAQQLDALLEISKNTAVNQLANLPGNAHNLRGGLNKPAGRKIKTLANGDDRIATFNSKEDLVRGIGPTPTTDAEKHARRSRINKRRREEYDAIFDRVRATSEKKSKGIISFSRGFGAGTIGPGSFEDRLSPFMKAYLDLATSDPDLNLVTITERPKGKPTAFEAHNQAFQKARAEGPALRAAENERLKAKFGIKRFDEQPKDAISILQEQFLARKKKRTGTSTPLDVGKFLEEDKALKIAAARKANQARFDAEFGPGGASEGRANFRATNPIGVVRKKSFNPVELDRVDGFGNKLGKKLTLKEINDRNKKRADAFRTAQEAKRREDRANPNSARNQDRKERRARGIAALRFRRGSGTDNAAGRAERRRQRDLPGGFSGSFGIDPSAEVDNRSRISGRQADFSQIMTPEQMRQIFATGLNQTDKGLVASIARLSSGSGGKNSSIFQALSDADGHLSGEIIRTKLTELQNKMNNNYSVIASKAFGVGNFRTEGLFSSAKVSGNRYIQGTINQQSALARNGGNGQITAAVGNLLGLAPYERSIISQVIGKDFFPSLSNLQKDVSPNFHNGGKVSRGGTANLRTGEAVIRPAQKSSGGSDLSKVLQTPAWVDTFANSVNALVGTKVQIELAPAQVSVNVNGMEVLQAMESGVKNMIRDEIVQAVSTIYHSDGTGKHKVR